MSQFVNDIASKLNSNEISIREAVGLTPSVNELIDRLTLLNCKRLAGKVKSFVKKRQNASTKRLARFAPSHDWLN